MAALIMASVITVLYFNLIRFAERYYNGEINTLKQYFDFTTIAMNVTVLFVYLGCVLLQYGKLWIY